MVSLILRLLLAALKEERANPSPEALKRGLEAATERVLPETAEMLDLIDYQMTEGRGRALILYNQGRNKLALKISPGTNFRLLENKKGVLFISEDNISLLCRSEAQWLWITMERGEEGGWITDGRVISEKQLREAFS